MATDIGINFENLFTQTQGDATQAYKLAQEQAGATSPKKLRREFLQFLSARDGGKFQISDDGHVTKKEDKQDTGLPTDMTIHSNLGIPLSGQGSFFTVENQGKVYESFDGQAEQKIDSLKADITKMEERGSKVAYSTHWREKKLLGFVDTSTIAVDDRSYGKQFVFNNSDGKPFLFLGADREVKFYEVPRYQQEDFDSSKLKKVKIPITQQYGTMDKLFNSHPDLTKLLDIPVTISYKKNKSAKTDPFILKEENISLSSEGKVLINYGPQEAHRVYSGLSELIIDPYIQELKFEEA